jgi:hypothetical protein
MYTLSFCKKNQVADAVNSEIFGSLSESRIEPHAMYGTRGGHPQAREKLRRRVHASNTRYWCQASELGCVATQVRLSIHRNAFYYFFSNTNAQVTILSMPTRLLFISLL